MAHVLYIIWWEGFRRGGLIENQVYRQLEHTRRAGTHTLSILSGGPFWLGRLKQRLPHLPALAHRGGDWTDPAALRARLDHQGIRIHFRNTLWRPATLYLGWWQLLSSPWRHLYALHRLCRREGIDIVHCRSYFPAWLALLSRTLLGGRYKIIFDTRGLLPEEGVATGALRAQGPSYRCWKRVERWLLTRADQVVNVSETLTEDLRAQGGPQGMATIYASVDTAAFTTQASTPAVAETARALAGRKVLAYLGAISATSWHSIPYLVRLYRLFASRFGDTCLLLITTTDHAALSAALEAEGVPGNEIRIQAADSTAEVAGLLRLATYAALPSRDMRGDHDRRIAHTMIASKTGEYLAAGVPILCNRSIGGASHLIHADAVGTVLDLDATDKTRIQNIADPDGDPALRDRCRRVAERFAMARIAQQYAALYTRMTTP